MRLWVIFLIQGAILLLQVTVLDCVRITGIKPDLMLILVIFSGFLRGSREGAFLGIIGGLLEDLLAGSYFGLNALSKIAAGYLAGQAKNKLYTDNLIIVMIVTWLVTLASQLVFYLLLSTLGIVISLETAFLKLILPLSIYNAIISLFLYRFFLKVQRHKGIY